MYVDQLDPGNLGDNSGGQPQLFTCSLGQNVVITSPHPLVSVSCVVEVLSDPVLSVWS